MRTTFFTRFPTVLSLKQLQEDENGEVASCGPLASVACATRAGCSWPVYEFSTTSTEPAISRTTDLQESTSESSGESHGIEERSPVHRQLSELSLDSSSDVACSEVSSLEEGSFESCWASSTGGPSPLSPVTEPVRTSELDSVLLDLWDNCNDKGMFRYDVAACDTRVLPGRWGFVAQLNEGRANKKRPTEFRVDLVCQAFDDSKFNFRKAFSREVLLQFAPSAAADGRARLLPGRAAPESPNLVLINVSPIEYGHVLLVPRVMDCLPQRITPDTMELALQFARASGNPFMRVGYNSLGAFATINHLHFQAYYLAMPFPCERATTEAMPALSAASGVVVSRTTDYPVRGLVVEAPAETSLTPAERLWRLAAAVGTACQRLQDANVPFNLLLTGGGSRVFLWPQRYTEAQAQGEVPEDLLETGMNPAAFEVAGHLVLKRQLDYDAFDEGLTERLLGMVGLPEARFQEVARMCFGDGVGSA